MKEAVEFKPFVFAKNPLDVKMIKESMELKGLDPGMKMVLERFLNFPLNPMQSCTGHVKETVESNVIGRPHLTFLADRNVEPDIRKIQDQFREKIKQLEETINRRCGEDVVKIELNEELHELTTGGTESDYTLWFKMQKPVKNGREILVIIWEEFFKYFRQFDGKNPPLPDFKGGSVFVEKVTK